MSPSIVNLSVTSSLIVSLHLPANPPEVIVGIGGCGRGRSVGDGKRGWGVCAGRGGGGEGWREVHSGR